MRFWMAAILAAGCAPPAFAEEAANPWFPYAERLEDVERRQGELAERIHEIDRDLATVGQAVERLIGEVQELQADEPTAQPTTTNKLVSTPTIDAAGVDVCIDADGDGVCDDAQAATEPAVQYRTVRVKERVRVPCETCPSGWAWSTQWTTKQVPIDASAAADDVCDCGCELAGCDCGMALGTSATASAGPVRRWARSGWFPGKLLLRGMRRIRGG